MRPCELLCFHVEGSACARGSRVHAAAYHFMERVENMSDKIDKRLTNESLPS
jgi:hypothetical protein